MGSATAARHSTPPALLLTTRDVAAALSVSETTVKRLARDGVLTRLKVGRSTRFDARELARYVAGLAPQADEQAAPISPGQLRAFHAKANDLDKALEQQRGDSKTAALRVASRRFGRTIRSASDLTAAEASLILDHLDEELQEARG